MSGKRAKALKAEARRKAKTGAYIINEEYFRLKRTLNHPTYARVKALHPSKPGRLFTGAMRKQRAQKLGISVHKILSL